MTGDSSRSPALIAVLSILGILVIAITAGLILMQKQANPGGGIDIGSVLSSHQVETAQDEFDPISWAREGAAYPPLQEEEEVHGDFVADYTGTGVIPSVEEPSEPELIRQPAAVSPPPAKMEAPGPTFREIRENAYWVQVFSSGNVNRAEEIRDKLTTAGFPANVIVREVDGKTWYRVRIGAFGEEGEAEHYAEKIRALSGYESSYVVQAPVSRRVPIDG